MKTKMITLIVLVLTFVSIVIALVSVHPQMYLNMTEAQSDAQMNRFMSEYETACDKAGGSFEAGQYPCTAPIALPDQSWYIQPIDNPTYNVWQVVGPVLFVVNILVFIVIVFIILRIGEDRSEHKRTMHNNSGAA